MDEEVTQRIWAVCLTIVALALLGGLTACGMNDTAAKTTQITACVANGGQWLKVPETTSSFECRRA